VRVRYRARRRFGPFAINIAPGRGMLPRVSSVAVKIGPVTRNLTRGTTSINTPGLGSVQLDGGRSRRPARRQYPPGTDDVAVAEIQCRHCGSQPTRRCQRPSEVPVAHPHKSRRDDAADLIESRGDYTPGGRSGRPGPIRPLGRLVQRILGVLLVIGLVWLWATVLGLHTAGDVIRWETGL
jgi:hypothetical protein